MRVLIAGGGLGGLTLAHGLRAAGLPNLEVAVFERSQPDPDLASSYRIHLDPAGSHALHACVPPSLWNTFLEHAAAPPRGIAFATEQLHALVCIPELEVPGDPVARSHPISRTGLRQLLLTGLEDVVSFGARLVRYEQTSDGQVIAHFDDGRTATGDVLVGADGTWSAVRTQLLPRARVIDTGVGGIAGKLYLTDQVRTRVPRELLSQMTMLLPARGLGMFTAPFQRQPGRPRCQTLDLPEHLFWVLIGSRGDLELVGAAHRPPAAQLQALALQRVAPWHPFLRWMVAESDPNGIIGVPLFTAEPVAPWPTTNVTLLGDAIHTMPPLQGLGGNMALRDAAVLAHYLVDAVRARTAPRAAIHAYETVMLDYGFDAVRRSVQVADSVASTNVLGRLAFRSVLRLADRLPGVRRRLFQRPAPNLLFELAA